MKIFAHILGIILGVITITIALIISPIITFGAGYLGGMILELIVGDCITSTLNTIFDTTRFTNDLIPPVCAALAVLGSFFKPSIENKKDE